MRLAAVAGLTVVTGATSVLGWALTCEAERRFPGAVVPCCNRHARHVGRGAWTRFNLEDRGAWRSLFDEHEVATLIHAGGVCDVDRCEADPEFAWAVNVGGVEAMLDALPDHVRLVHCSSDHVFGGRSAPYTEDDPPEPISAYGRTRAAAEARVRTHGSKHLIVRVGLPIGSSVDGRTGHLDWLRYRHRHGLPMTIIVDEARSVIAAEDAAARVLDLAFDDVGGTRHLAAPALSRVVLAERLCAQLGIDPELVRIARDQLDTPHLGRVELATLYGSLP